MVSFRYKDSNTVIHKLNPFCKLIWVSSILIFALIFDDPVYVCLLFLSTLPVIIVAKVWREWISLMKYTVYLCLAIVIINALVNHNGSHILLQASFYIPLIGTLVITLEAIFFGLVMAVRLMAIISAFAIVTFTIHPDDLMLSMIKMRLPYKSVLVTSLSTRFVPTLIADAECISEVQRSRGLELDKGNLVQRIKSRMAIVIPLLSNSLDRTVQVAEAMEARAFGSGEKRTYYKEIRISRIDGIALVIGFFTCAFGIFINLSGYGQYQFYPALEGIHIDSFEWVMLSFLIFLLFSIILMAFVKRRVELD